MAKKIKLCLFIHSLAGGGAERFIIHLTNNLNREIFDIYLILLKAEGEYLHLLPADIKIVDLRIKSFRLSQVPHPGWLLKIAQAFRNINPDVIFSTMTTTNLMAIVARQLAFLKVPLIIQEAGILGDHLKFDWLGALKKAIYKVLVRHADLVVVPAQAMADDLEKLFAIKSDRLKVIPNPVDFHHIDESLKNGVLAENVAAQKKLKIIVSMGRLEKIKGVDIGIKAFAELQRRIPAYYWVLGQGGEEESLKKMAADLGISQRVNFLGFQDNPYIFLKNADCFLLSSRSEGHPYTLMEAMYCEVPCVVSRYSSSVADLIKDGEAGIVVESGNTAQMAEAMEQILKDGQIRSKFIKNAKITVEKYGTGQVLPEYEKLFLSCTGKVG